MPIRRSASGRRRIAVIVATLLSLSGIVGLAATPASAATLTKMSWTVSNSQTGKTGVTYSWAFTTATAATLTAVTLTVPTGTAGTPAVGSVYGVGAGTVALAGTTITYTITTPAAIAANIPVYLSFTGLTNTTTANSYTSLITTQKSGPTTVDTGTTSSVTFGSSSTTASVTVGQTLTFTNNLFGILDVRGPDFIEQHPEPSRRLDRADQCRQRLLAGCLRHGAVPVRACVHHPGGQFRPHRWRLDLPDKRLGSQRGTHHRRYRRGGTRLGTLGWQVRRLPERTGQLPHYHRSHGGDSGHIDSDEPSCR